MKNFKATAKFLPFLFMLFAMGSCKKNSSDPGLDENAQINQVTASDLENYYIVSERKTGTKKLSLLSFVKEGTTIKASLNGRGYLRAKTVTTTSSKLVFDVDDNGAAVYSFEFEKDASGRIKLKSYDYAAESGGLSYAVLAKKNEGLAYENSTLNTGNILFKLNGNTIEWDLQNRRTGTIVVGGQPIPVFSIAPEFTLPTYSLSGLGFKSNNDQFLGISVPNWKATTTPVLLLEKDGVVMESVKNL